MSEYEKDSITATKNSFEESFRSGSLYNKQTQSSEHLDKILSALLLSGGNTVLDLGTGSGYLTFAVAKEYKQCSVVGLDIVEKTLVRNREEAVRLGLDNVSFVSYGGIDFPFDSGSFDCVMTRYALHHFPKIEMTFSEVSRILNRGGYFFISDPTPNANDNEGFADDYMRMKKDGHIKYYTKDEFCALAKNVGVELCAEFQSEIRFPRLKATAEGFDEIMKKHSKEIIDGYNVSVTEDGKYIYITQRVLNLTFKKL